MKVETTISQESNGAFQTDIVRKGHSTHPLRMMEEPTYSWDCLGRVPKTKPRWDSFDKNPVWVVQRFSFSLENRGEEGEDLFPLSACKFMIS